MKSDMSDNLDCFGLLWLAVLARAVEDALIELPPLEVHAHNSLCEPGCRRLEFTPAHYWRRTAVQWIQSDDDHVGSFQWICDTVGLDIVTVRGEFNDKFQAARLTRAARRARTEKLAAARRVERSARGAIPERSSHPAIPARGVI